MSYYDSYGLGTLELSRLGLGSLGDAAQVSAGVAAGAGTAGALVAAGALTTFGVAAQAVPVIGNIIGAVAIAAGFIAKAQGKAKAIKQQRNEIDEQNYELNTVSQDLTNDIITMQGMRTQISAQLKSAGLSGFDAPVSLNGFGDFLKKVFTPSKVEQGKLDDAVALNTRLTDEINTKTNTLKSIIGEFETLYKKLTQGTTAQNIVLYGSIALAASAGGYLLYRYLSKS